MSGSKLKLSVSEKQIATVATLVAKAQSELGDLKPMGSAERLQAVKPKAGTAMVVPAIKALVEKYELPSKYVTLDDSSSLFAYAATLKSLLTQVVTLEQSIKDEILRSESSAWTSISVAYGMLQKVSIASPALEAELAPVEAWFRKGRVSSKASTPASKPASPEASVDSPLAKA